MRRREFIALVSATAVMGPSAATAAIPLLCNIQAGSPDRAAFLKSFHQGLEQVGVTPGQDLQIVDFWAHGDLRRFPELARAAVAMKPSIILAGGTAAALAAKAVTASIPIVFTTGDDPLAAGLVTSLKTPEGNVTGVTRTAGDLGAKRLQLLRGFVADLRRIGVIYNPTNVGTQRQVTEFERIRADGLEIVLLSAPDVQAIEQLSPARLEHVDGLVIVSDPLFTLESKRLADVALQAQKPAIYAYREFPDHGGLMSYGGSFEGAYSKAGEYVAKLLKGASVEQLPVTQPNTFDLVLNLRTAGRLGLRAPVEVLALANEVIE